MSETLIDALRHQSCYPHAVTTIEVIESDLAWILLTGQFAYKIKKPVDLYFLDASSLESRHELCHSEFTLNQRSFSELYIDGLASIKLRLESRSAKARGSPSNMPSKCINSIPTTP
ncbi:MAG: hypothetical protein L7S50_04525 [Litoricolaceae bacterium]|nr:hypothetical protein [Litorivicinaceae bacterium]